MPVPYSRSLGADDSLSAAGAPLAATGNAVALCPTYGTDTTGDTENGEVVR